MADFWVAGEARSSDRDPEPEARARLRHDYLPPLRHAQRELNSGSGNRLRVILNYLLAEQGVSEADFVSEVNVDTKHGQEKRYSWVAAVVRGAAPLSPPAAEKFAALVPGVQW